MNCRNFLVVLLTVLCTCTSGYASDFTTSPVSDTPRFALQFTNNFTLEKNREIDKDTYPFIHLAQNAEEFDDPFGEEFDEDFEGSVEEIDTINDPLQGFNRAMFTFNDKFFREYRHACSCLKLLHTGQNERGGNRTGTFCD